MTTPKTIDERLFAIREQLGSPYREYALYEVLNDWVWELPKTKKLSILKRKRPANRWVRLRSTHVPRRRRN
jgi:hypothetical protein